ncbi:MAG TPA: hypothetical protein VGL40_09295 [Bacillota bacterium]|jgi:hypothetical protein
MGQKTVIGVFKSRNQADKAIDELQQKGFKKGEINVVTKQQGMHGAGGGQSQGNHGATSSRGSGQMTSHSSQGQGSGPRGATGSRAGEMGYGGEDVSEGVTTGGVIGGVAGLLAGAGALAIPGIGPLLAAGPIAGALTGAVTGGVAGGLVDYGIPEESSHKYEQQVKEGNILAMVKADEQKVNEAALIFRQNGATDVETH